MRFVEKENEFGFLDVADFGEALEEFAEEPKEERGVSSRIRHELVGAEDIDHAAAVGVGLDEIVEIHRRLAEKLVAALLLEREQIPLDGAPAGRRQLAPYDITDFNTYVGALYTVALENLNPVQPADWPRTISIDFLNFSPKIKRISDAQKQQLMDSGRKGAQAFLARQAGQK